MKLDFSDGFEKNSECKDRVKEILFNTLERCKELQQTKDPLLVDFDWTEKDFTLKESDGVHGRTISSEKIEIEINTEVEGWQDRLRNQFSHEYAHKYFFEVTGFKYESDIENWRHILLEAHGEHFSQKAYPEINAYWRTHIPKKKISKKWAEIKPLMNQNIFSEKNSRLKRLPTILRILNGILHR